MEDTSLRARKKQKLRLHIQQCALELFHKEGYRNTTIEHIAQLAEVAPATFFHYFPTKERVVFDSLLDEGLLNALMEQDRSTSFISGLRQRLDEVLESLSPEEVLQKERIFTLINVTPELRAGLVQAISIEGMSFMIALVAQYTNKDMTDMQVRVLAGSVVGVAISVFLDSEDCSAVHCIERFRTALRLLEERIETSQQ